MSEVNEGLSGKPKCEWCGNARRFCNAGCFKWFTKAFSIAQAKEGSVCPKK